MSVQLLRSCTIRGTLRRLQTFDPYGVGHSPLWSPKELIGDGRVSTVIFLRLLDQATVSTHDCSSSVRTGVFNVVTGREVISMRALLIALAMIAVFAIAAAGSTTSASADADCCQGQAHCPGCDGCK